MTARIQWLAAAGAPRRALDGLAALAATSAPLREVERGLAGLVGEPLAELTAPVTPPRLLEDAIARALAPAADASDAAAPRVSRAAPLPAGSAARRAPLVPAAAERAIAAGDTEAKASRRPAIAASAPEVKAAVERALGRGATAASSASTPSTSGAPSSSTTSSPSSRWRPADPSPAARTAATRPVATVPGGLDAFADRVAGGRAAARRALTPPADRARRSIEPPPATPAPATPAPADHARRSTAPAAPAATVPAAITSAPAPLDLAPAVAPAAAPRGLAGLVTRWNAAPAASAAPAAPAAPAVAAAAADALAAPATLATSAPPVGELIALDTLAHAIERVLVAEVRRHGLLVEDP